MSYLLFILAGIGIITGIAIIGSNQLTKRAAQAAKDLTKKK